MKLLFTDEPARHLQWLVDRFAGWTFTIILLITIGGLWALRDLRFENATGKLDLPSDDLVRVQRDEFESRFGGGQIILIGLQFDRRVDSDAIRLIRSLADRMSDIHGVHSVFSVADASEMIWAPSLGVYVLRRSKIVPEDEEPPAAIDSSITRILTMKPYVGNLISSDGRAAAIVVTAELPDSAKTAGLSNMQRLVGDLRQITRTAREAGVTVVFAGTPILNIGLQKAMRRDLTVFGPLSLLVFVAILYIVLRSWKPVVSAVVTAVISLVWAVALLPLTDTPMSISLSMMVPLILAISIMQSIHLLVCVLRANETPDRRLRVTACWRSILMPNLLCGLTTAIGFFSIGISPMPGIREVGVFVSAGVILTTVVTNFFLPAFLITVPWRTGGVSPPLNTGIVARIIPVLQRLVLPRPRLFVAVVAALVVIIGTGIDFLRVETNHLEYLSRDKELIRSFRFIDEHLGGVVPLEVLIDVPAAEAAKALPAVVAFEDSLRAMPDLGSAVSAADFIMQAEHAKPSQPVPLRPSLHVTRGYVPAQVWDLVENPTSGGRYVDRRDSLFTVRVSCRTHIEGSDKLRRLTVTVREMLDRHFPHYESTVTGLAPYFARVDDYVISTQIESFGAALLVVVLLLGLVCGSLKTGLAAIAVNVVPVVGILGIMGWLDIPLDISTVMIAAIALGMVVDDTIHFVYRYRRHRMEENSVETSIDSAFAEVGLPVLSTSIILAAGFASLIPARFTPTSYFGGLAALAVVIALIADLLLLPALILVIERKRTRRN